MTNDPRYSNSPARETIHVVQTPPNSTQHLLLGMLVLQLVFMAGLVFWIANSGPDPVSQQAASDSNQQQTIRQQAQAELLVRVVEGQAGNGELATEFARLKEQEFLLRSSLDGQLARLEKEATLRQHAENELQKSSELGQRLRTDLEQTQTRLAQAKQQIELANPSSELASDQATSSDWLLWLAGGLGLLGVGGFAGYSYHAKQDALQRRRQIASEHDVDSFDLAESSAAEIEYHERPVTTH